MATYQIIQKKNSKYVKIHYWCPVLGKQKMLPRVHYEYLDRCSESVIVDFCRRLDKDLGLNKNESLSFKHLELDSYLVEYDAQLFKDGLDRHTIKQYLSYLRNYGVPFFTNDVEVEGVLHKKLEKIEDWPSKSPFFRDWYLNHTGNSPEMARVNIATIKRFWKWLKFKQYIYPTADPEFSHRLRSIRIGSNQKVAILPRPVEPDEILEFADSTDSNECRFIALVAYGASLRPQEVFRLSPSFFLTPQQAEHFEVNVRRAHMKMYNRLSINVVEQISRNGPKPAKTIGVTPLLDERFAKRLLPFLEVTASNSRFLNSCVDWCYTKWRRFGIEGLTVKDLRRASLHYLAHNTPYNHHHIDLMKFARHEKFSTTEIYLKTPWISKSLKCKSAPTNWSV